MIARCYRWVLAPSLVQLRMGRMHRRQLVVGLERLGPKAISVYLGTQLVKQFGAQRNWSCASRNKWCGPFWPGITCCPVWAAAKESSMKQSYHETVADKLVACFRQGSGDSLAEYSDGHSRQLYFSGSGESGFGHRFGGVR